MGCPPVCPPASCPPPYQPLPISTGTVGLDRCGNIEAYAAPRVVRRPVTWNCWPIPPTFPGWSNAADYDGWAGGPGPISGGLAGLAAVMTMGAPMAQWMINARRQGSV